MVQSEHHWGGGTFLPIKVHFTEYYFRLECILYPARNAMNEGEGVVGGVGTWGHIVVYLTCMMIYRGLTEQPPHIYRKTSPKSQFSTSNLRNDQFEFTERTSVNSTLGGGVTPRCRPSPPPPPTLEPSLALQLRDYRISAIRRPRDKP